MDVRRHLPALHASRMWGPIVSDVPTDPEADDVSQRVYALIVNGVTRAGYNVENAEAE